MSRVISRRELLSFKGLTQFIQDVLPSDREDQKRQDSLREYFSSPLYSYPLLQEMPWEMLIEEAAKKGITTEGRTKNDIARELFCSSSS